MDRVKRCRSGLLFAILGIVLICVSQGFAYDINDKFSIGGIIAGVYQYQSLSDAPGYDNEGRGVLVFQPEVSFKPIDSDEVFAKFGFGAGNGLMEEGRSPFIPAASHSTTSLPSRGMCST